MIAPISMSITDNTATVTDGNGDTYTAHDVHVEPGDWTGMENYGAGWYFVVKRDGEEVQRQPLRDASGWHFTDLTSFTVPPNPIFPTATDETGER
ncbi:hypothetical protein ACWDSF_06205 [Nocardia beijingensis]